MVKRGLLLISVTLGGGTGSLKTFYPLLSGNIFLPKPKVFGQFPRLGLEYSQKGTISNNLGSLITLINGLPLAFKWPFSPFSEKAFPQHPIEQERATEGRLES